MKPGTINQTFLGRKKLALVILFFREGAKFMGLHQGQWGGGLKVFGKKKMTGQTLFLKKKMMGRHFFRQKITGLGPFLQKKNDAAKTFFGMNS